jgi:hypothetical protein
VPPDAFLVANTGNYKRDMAVDAVITAVGELPEDVHVAFVGRGYDEWMTVAAAALGGDRIHFPGAVPANAVTEYISGADAALIAYAQTTTNARNGLPNGFLAPVAAALPVAYTPLPEVVRICSEFGIGSAIEPLTPATIARAIESLRAERDDPAARERVLKASRTCVWDNELPALRQLVESAVT